MDQYLALTIIGVIILVIGVILMVMRKKGGLLLTLLGGLWLLTMGIYYAFLYTGVYTTGLYPVANIIGVIILILGIIVVLYVWKKYGVLKR